MIRKLFKKLKKLRFRIVPERPLEEEHKLTLDTFISGKKIILKNTKFEISIEDLEIKNCIGKGGGSAFIYKALWKKMNKIVAFKCFKTDTSLCGDDENMEEFEREVSVFSLLDHPNILTFFGCTLYSPRIGIRPDILPFYILLTTITRIGIVMEYCKYGDGENFIKANPKLLTSIRISLLCEISSAMNYLHKKSIIHRDLKLNNFLIDEKISSRLMDFGLSRLVERMSVTKTKRIGTSIYMAPEVCQDARKYDEKCDVFSYGILMWQIVTCKLKPYGEKEHNLQFKVMRNPDFRPDSKAITNAKGLNISSKIKKKILNLMKKCWDHESSVRPSFEKINKTLTEIYDSIPKVEYVIENFEETDKSVLGSKKSAPTITKSETKPTKKKKIKLLKKGDSDDTALETSISDLTVDGLFNAATELLSIKKDNISKICKRIPGGAFRKISKNTTVEKMEDNITLYVVLN